MDLIDVVAIGVRETCVSKRINFVVNVCADGGYKIVEMITLRLSV